MARLLHRRHTGHLAPHHRSSYGGLMVMIGLLGVFLLSLGPAAYGKDALVGNAANNALSDSVSITGTVPGPAPSTKATILSPRNGSSIGSLPITISGLCTAGLIVSIYDNETFVGSTACSTSGAFTLSADLFIGANTLMARVNDALGQYGPDSDPINVTYAPPSLSLPGSVTIAHQLFLTSTATERGGNPGSDVTWPITIVGGVAPYALSIDWGDGTTQLVSRPFDGAVNLPHTYKRAGVYRVTFTASDASGDSALLQVVTVINGPVTPLGSGTGTKIEPGIIISVWPLYILTALMVLIFFLGERRELRKLRKRHQLVTAYS